MWALYEKCGKKQKNPILEYEILSPTFSNNSFHKSEEDSKSMFWSFAKAE